MLIVSILRVILLSIEATSLLGVHENLLTPRHGIPLIVPTQDFLTASFLLSRKDVFFEQAQFCRICAYLSDANEKIDLPHPAILKVLCVCVCVCVYV